ncbi:MAG: ABC transporter permease [Candidatus Omnitrophota bacterium]
MPNLALSNIYRRKLRASVAILAVGLGIALLLVLAGVTRGSINELVSRIKNVGADIVVQPQDANFFLPLKSGLMSTDLKDKIARIEGVEAVAPVFTWGIRIGNNIHVVYGIEEQSFQKVGAKIVLLKGRSPQSDLELVMDVRMAEAKKLKLGESVKIFGKNFTLVGISKPGVAARIYMPLATLQKKVDQGNKVNVFFVKVKTPEKTKEVAKAIESQFPNLKVNAADEIASIVSKSLAGLNEFVIAMCAFALIVSSLVVLLAMYTTIYERTREIGILKALGASNFYIIKCVVAESTMLSVLGVLLGYVLTYATREWMRYKFPLLTLEVTPGELLTAFGIGIIVGVMGAILPAIAAARKDPVEALRYE